MNKVRKILSRLLLRKSDARYQILVRLHVTKNGYEIEGLVDELNMDKNTVDEALSTLMRDGLVQRLENEDRVYYIDTANLVKLQNEIETEQSAILDEYDLPYIQ